MADIVARHAPNDGFHATPIEPLHLFRFSAPNRSFYQSRGAALCLIAQGAKTVTMGEENYFYDPAHFFLVAADLPLIGRVTHASPAAPYLGLHLAIDPTQISELIADAKLLAQAGRAPQRGISVGQVDAPLLDAATRLVHLLETPQHIPVLGPMLVREITYGLLTGNAGEDLRRIAFASSNAGVMRALNWLKSNYTAPLHIEELARRVHMSASSFHHQFKAVTAMSPLQ